MLIEQDSPFGRAAGRELPFPETLPGLAALPDVFRQAIGSVLMGPEVEPVAILYTPPFVTIDSMAPDSVLVLRESDWGGAWGGFETGIQVRGGSMEGIEKIQLAQVLLEGALTIEHEADPHEGGVKIQFNLVGLDMFRAVTESLLAGFPSPAEPPLGALPALTTKSEAWRALPFKLRSALLDAVPAGESVRAIAAWPAIQVEGLAWRAGQASPAGLLAVTERYLCTIIDAIPLERGEIASVLSQYGKVVTYLSRRGGVRWVSANEEHGARLTLNVGQASRRASTLELQMPAQSIPAVESVLMRLGSEF